jgi:type II secretion system protein H
MVQTACPAAAAQMLISWSKFPQIAQYSRVGFSPPFAACEDGGLKPTLRNQAGFTLLELLVALVIISLMTAVVGFSVSNSSQRTLKGEGDKLAARLNAAHAQMNAGASPIRLIATQDKDKDKPQSGYAFETTLRADDGSATASWKPVTGDEVLAPRALPSGSTLRLNEPLLIAREPITAASSITLEQGDVRVRIATDGINGWAAQ